MPRCHGSYIGHVPAPTQSAASGVWKLHDAQENLAGGTWPSQPAVPGAPNATAGDEEVVLTWSALTASPTVTDYGIQYSDDAGETWTTFTDSVSDATTATVTGLTNGTAYVFRLYGINALGDGPYGSASAAVTPGFSVDYLILGGGGGGDDGVINVYYGCGGAAGVARSGTVLLALGVAHTVTVGGGGAPGAEEDETDGFPGSNSSLNAIVATGGYATDRQNGTGGTNADFDAGLPGDNATSGGGAGSAGDGDGMDGGVGAASSITGSSVTRGGGGGGGSAGVGGTGGGGDYDDGGAGPYSGEANTGSGGGGCSQPYTAGAGGSGVVILRSARTASATTGSPDVTTDDDDNIIYTFTGSGSITF